MSEFVTANDSDGTVWYYIRQSLFEEWKARAEQAEKQLDDRDNELLELKKQLADWRYDEKDEIEKLEAELASKEKQLAEVKLELSIAREHLAIRGILFMHDDAVRLQAELAAKDAELEVVRGDLDRLKEREQMVHDLGKDYAKPKLRVRELETELAVKDAELHQLTHACDLRDRIINEKNVELEAKDARIKELEGMLSKSLAADEL